MNIWLLSDHSTRTAQAKAVATRLGSEIVEISTLQIARSGWPDNLVAPQMAIGAGEAVADSLLQAKSKTGCKTVCILNPQRNHTEFDMLVLPDWEPSPDSSNIITTKCLLNHVTPELLTDRPSNSASIAILIGGKHVGGNITPDDIAELAELLNSTKHQPSTTNRFLISTSRRTEMATVAAIRREFCCHPERSEGSYPADCSRDPSPAAQDDNVLYDFNSDSHLGNPYLDFMAASDGIIVSGDSVRMVSEACSSGKPVWIWNPPSTKFNPYAKLHENLVATGAARMFTSDLTPYAPNTLREADRIAAIIRDRLLS